MANLNMTVVGLELPLDVYELTPQDTLRFKEEHDLGMVWPQDLLLSQVIPRVDAKDIESTRIQRVITRLMHAANSQQKGNRQDKNKRTLVGLAAPQIGEAVRIIVVDTRITVERKNPGHLEVFINPEIISMSSRREDGREGCFSAGPVWGIVRRAKEIKIRAYDGQGKLINRTFTGFTARIFQHEYDHLQGIRFPERIASDNKRHWVHSEEIPAYVEHYKHWPRKCSAKRWEAFKALGT